MVDAKATNHLDQGRAENAPPNKCVTPALTKM